MDDSLEGVFGVALVPLRLSGVIITPGNVKSLMSYVAEFGKRSFSVRNKQNKTLQQAYASGQFVLFQCLHVRQCKYFNFLN